MPPSAAVSALVTCADAWLPRPRTARPDLNPLDTTPIPTKYNPPTNAGSVGKRAARVGGRDGDVSDVGQRRTAAKRVGPTGRVVLSDVAAEMVAVAGRRASANTTVTLTSVLRDGGLEDVTVRVRSQLGTVTAEPAPSRGPSASVLGGAVMLDHAEREYLRSTADRITVSAAASSPMTQPAALSAPRIAPSTAPAASTAIDVTDTESRSVRGLGCVGALVDSVVGPRRRPAGGSLAVRAWRVAVRWRRRSVRSAVRLSPVDGKSSWSAVACSAAGCRLGPVRRGSWRLALGSLETTAG